MTLYRSKMVYAISNQVRAPWSLTLGPVEEEQDEDGKLEKSYQAACDPHSAWNQVTGASAPKRSCWCAQTPSNVWGWHGPAFQIIHCTRKESELFLGF